MSRLITSNSRLLSFILTQNVMIVAMEPILILLVVLLIAINAFVVWKLVQPKEQKPENTEGLICSKSKSRT